MSRKKQWRADNRVWLWRKPVEFFFLLRNGLFFCRRRRFLLSLSFKYERVCFLFNHDNLMSQDEKKNKQNFNKVLHFFFFDEKNQFIGRALVLTKGFHISTIQRQSFHPRMFYVISNQESLPATSFPLVEFQRMTNFSQEKSCWRNDKKRMESRFFLFFFLCDFRVQVEDIRVSSLLCSFGVTLICSCSFLLLLLFLLRRFFL